MADTTVFDKFSPDFVTFVAGRTSNFFCVIWVACTRSATLFIILQENVGVDKVTKNKKG